MRSILSESYGVDLDAVTWVTTEGAHLAEYTDPPNVRRMAMGSDGIADMLFAGKLDAAIFGADMPRDRPDLVPLFPTPMPRRINGTPGMDTCPINHMLAVDARSRRARARDGAQHLSAVRRSEGARSDPEVTGSTSCRWGSMPCARPSRQWSIMPWSRRSFRSA